MRLLASSVTLFALFATPFVAGSARAISATGDYGCGLLDPDQPVPGESQFVDDDPLNATPPPIALSGGWWACSSSLTPRAFPVAPRADVSVSTTGAPQPIDRAVNAKGSYFVEYDVAELLPGGPGGNIPVILTIAGNITLDAAHGRTTGTITLLSSMPFVVEGSGLPPTTLYQKFGNTEFGTCTSGCTFSDTLLATATVGSHFYNLGVGLTAFPWEALGAADGTAWIDPEVYVDPDATFGEGLLYADYYGVVLPDEVTPVVPEPSTAMLLGAGLLGLGTARRRGLRV